LRSGAGTVCMTERGISYFVRYSSRLLACFACSASASASGVSAGSRIPWARASSSIVCGRRQPSRWTCNSALGQRRSTSLERRGGPLPAPTTTPRMAPPPPPRSPPPPRRPPPSLTYAPPLPSRPPRSRAGAEGGGAGAGARPGTPPPAGPAAGRGAAPVGGGGGLPPAPPSPVAGRGGPPGGFRNGRPREESPFGAPPRGDVGPDPAVVD